MQEEQSVRLTPPLRGPPGAKLVVRQTSPAGGNGHQQFYGPVWLGTSRNGPGRPSCAAWGRSRRAAGDVPPSPAGPGLPREAPQGSELLRSQGVILHCLCQGRSDLRGAGIKSRPGVGPVGCVLERELLELQLEPVTECRRFHLFHRVQFEELQQRRQKQTQRLTRVPVPALCRFIMQEPDGVVDRHLSNFQKGSPWFTARSTSSSGVWSNN